MRTVIFRGRRGTDSDSDPIELGRAELDGDVVRFSGAIAPGGADHARYRVDQVSIFDRRGGRLTPADGRRYLEALPRAFHGTHFWAAAAD